MATYEEILNREFTHEYLKKYDDGEDLTKYNTFKKFFELYVERTTYLFLMYKYLMYKYTTIDILSIALADKSFIVLNDPLFKIKEDY